MIKDKEANMAWHLRRKKDMTIPKLPKIPRIPRIPKVPKIRQVRPVKPIAPIGYEYYWRDD
jgi:hypothetical protein